METDLEKVTIDEEGTHALKKTKKVKPKNDKKLGLSDHNPIISKILLKWDRRKRSSRIEMFNLKNREGQAMFKDLTNNGTFTAMMM